MVDIYLMWLILLFNSLKLKVYFFRYYFSPQSQSVSFVLYFFFFTILKIFFLRKYYKYHDFFKGLFSGISDIYKYIALICLFTENI